jgi:molecular chaperone DnaK (HSP70)
VTMEEKTDVTSMRRIAVDFGTEQVIIGIRDGDGNSLRFLELNGFTRLVPSVPPAAAVPVVPCLIYFGDDGTVMIGEEVITQGLVQSPSTVRWMQHFIVIGSPTRLVGMADSMAGYPDAGAAFLNSLLAAVPTAVRGRETEINFVIPANAGIRYVDWIRSVGSAAGACSTRVTDAITATILGYGLPALQGRQYLLIDVDEGSLTVIVAVAGSHETSCAGQSSRVLGIAEDETGSTRVDGWIAGDVLSRLQLRISDTRVQSLYGDLLREAGRARERLATVPETTVHMSTPVRGIMVDAVITRGDLERILDAHGFLSLLRRTIDRAIAAAHGRGYIVDDTTTVLLTGGCCTIPCLQETVACWFGRERVYGDHALNARVLGALAAVPDVLEDRIMNDYAVRYWDAAAREHRYRFLVRAGTRYPSAGQVGRFVISAAYDGQTHLGIPLYSLGTGTGGTTAAIELVSDAAGGIRISGPAPGSAPEGRPVWVNVRTPTLLIASPPATRGEPRFELTFTVDGERQLCLTALDVQTGELVKRDALVYRLT